MPATVAVGDGTGPWPPLPRPASSPALVAACAPEPRFRSSVRSAPATAAGCLWPVAGGAWKGHSLAQPHRAHGRIGTPGAGRRLLLPPRLPPRLRPRPPPELAPAGGAGQARRAVGGGWRWRPGHSRTAWQLLLAQKPLNPHICCLHWPLAPGPLPALAPAGPEGPRPRQPSHLGLTPPAHCGHSPLAPRALSLSPPGAGPPQAWTHLNRGAGPDTKIIDKLVTSMDSGGGRAKPCSPSSEQWALTPGDPKNANGWASPQTRKSKP